MFAFSLLAGTLFAATPAQLGIDCARFTMKSFIHMIKIERFCLIKDQEVMGTYQNMASKCVLNAVDLKTNAERPEFLKAGLDYLQSMNLKNGADKVLSSMIVLVLHC